MGERTWRWVDAHYCSLSSQNRGDLYGFATKPQTNVYGFTKIIGSDGSNKLLTASLSGKIISVECQRIVDKLTPSTKEIQFTYIPGDAELISINAISKCYHGNGLIVGITFMKVKENEMTGKQFLNLYSSWQPGEEYSLDTVAEGCLSIELEFIPYQLTHTDLLISKVRESVFLLSGSDNKVHLYREINLQHTFREEQTLENFPEFQDMTSSILWMDILYLTGYESRITAFGCQNGLVCVTQVDVEKREIVKRLVTQLNSPITHIQIFTHENRIPCPSFIESAKVEREEVDDVHTVYNLLVLTALEPAVVYRNILSDGLQDPLVLADSEAYDIPLCGCVVDIDFDGENEILIGTYGQELLAYKLIQNRSRPRSSCLTESLHDDSGSLVVNDELEDDNSIKQRHRSSETKTCACSQEIKIPRRAKSEESLVSPGTTKTLSPIPQQQKQLHANQKVDNTQTEPADDRDKKREDNAVQSEIVKETETVKDFNEAISKELVDVPIQKSFYHKLWSRSFASPVVGVDKVDIMGDGMDDLVVVTLRGMHILQPNLKEVAKVCLERLQALADLEASSESDDSFRKLQVETFGR